MLFYRRMNFIHIPSSNGPRGGAQGKKLCPYGYIWKGDRRFDSINREKKGIPTFSGFSGHSMSLGFFKWLHAALISFFTHLSLVFQTVNFLIQQCPFLSKHETRWSVIILWKSFLFLSTPTRLITCHHIWFWQAFNWSSEHLTMCEFLPRVLSSPSRFKLHFALPVGSLDNVITFHLTFLNLWGKCLLILE